MKPYSHYLPVSTKRAALTDMTGLNDKELVNALKYTGLGSGIGAGSGLLGALLLESFKDPNEAQYLRKALRGAGLGALAGGGLGALYGFNQSPNPAAPIPMPDVDTLPSNRRPNPAAPIPMPGVDMLPFHQ